MFLKQLVKKEEQLILKIAQYYYIYICLPLAENLQDCKLHYFNDSQKNCVQCCC